MVVTVRNNRAYEDAKDRWHRILTDAHKTARGMDPLMGAWCTLVAPWHRLTVSDIAAMAQFLASLEVGRIRISANQGNQQEPVFDGFVHPGGW